MALYEALIDPANFGLIADYLRAPHSAINYILHVRSRSMLSEVAARLSQTNQLGSDATEAVTKLIEGLFREGALLISSRWPVSLSDPRCLVEASQIPRSTACEVLYLPPFYLAHTPGLFDGCLVRSTNRPDALESLPAQQRRVRIKP